MKPRRRRAYKPEVELKETGWTRWIAPLHGQGKNNYRLACCDCGLIHDMQFRVRKGSVWFRAKRNNRATAGLRRGKKVAIIKGV